MKLLGFAITVFSLGFAGLASAANSFAGSNLYYAAGLSPSQRATLLGGMQSAGMKVLRVWLDGQSTASTKVCFSPSKPRITFYTYPVTTNRPPPSPVRMF
jgi:mannan endo-1,4-beta-mannosidase